MRDENGQNITNVLAPDEWGEIDAYLRQTGSASDAWYGDL